jgi:hypothetical protein
MAVLLLFDQLKEELLIRTIPGKDIDRGLALIDGLARGRVLSTRHRIFHRLK